MTAKLPQTITNQLNCTDQRVLDLLVDMIQRSEKKNPSKKMYACPGEVWIGERTDRSRSWVSNSVQKLKNLGLLIVINRRKVRGRWQTNLYKLGYWILRIMGNLKLLITNTFQPCQVDLTHSSKTPLISKTRTAKKDFSYKLKVPDLAEVIKRMENNHPELLKSEGEDG